MGTRTVIGLIIAGLCLALAGLWYWQTSREHTLLVAAGQRSGQAFATIEAFREVVARHYPEIEIEVFETRGSLHNAKLLDDGAVWDGECMATLLDHLDRRGNEDAPPGAYAGCNRPCRPLHGRLQAGETCGVSQRYAQCDAGLECFDSRCVDPCAVPVAVGGSCLTAPCEEGARCDFDTRICVHGNAVRCGQGHCAPGQYCIDAECFDPIPTGEACTGHRQCDTRYCPAGYCLPRPEAGEACPADVCAEGLTCDSGTCELEPDGPDELQARVCQLPLALPEPEPLGD